MAHPQQLQFVKSITRSLTDDFRSLKVIEIGAYDVNGSIRQFFHNADYVGIDLIDGPGVDLVCEGDKVDHEDNTYDIAISCECFEHNPNWADTFLNMHRMTKEGGVVLFTCATTGRDEHGTTRTSPESSPGTQAFRWDYYRNLTQEDFEGSIKLAELFEHYFFLVNKASCDLYFFGYKGREGQAFPVTVDRLKFICTENQRELQGMITARKKREKFIPKPLRKLFRSVYEKRGGHSQNPRLIEQF